MEEDFDKVAEFFDRAVQIAAKAKALTGEAMCIDAYSYILDWIFLLWIYFVIINDASDYVEILDYLPYMTFAGLAQSFCCRWQWVLTVFVLRWLQAQN